MKIIFMGTPDFSVPCLEALVANPAHEVLAVVTQTDKPVGRSKKLVFPPVKQAAVSHNIEVLQPEKIKNKEFVEVLAQYNADIFIIAAYGQILSEQILSLPKYGCINVHASLLPKYRGASPIQSAIINGETVTGVTIMQMDKGLDTGDMLYKKEIEIDKDDTGGSLHDKLSIAGAEALKEALDLIEKNALTPQKQNGESATYAPLLNKEMGRIDWAQPPKRIVDLIRGLDPWPGAYTIYKNEKIKIWKAEICGQMSSGNCGEIIKTSKSEGIYVSANGGAVLITELQAAGGKRMKAADYLKGNEILLNTIL